MSRQLQQVRVLIILIDQDDVKQRRGSLRNEKSIVKCETICQLYKSNGHGH